MTATALPEARPQTNGDRPIYATVAAFVLTLACLVAVLQLFFGHWDHDGGAYLQRGAYVLSGLRPYLDYPSIYPPLMDALTAMVLTLPLQRIALALLIPLLWIAANTAATLRLANAATLRAAPAMFIASMFPLFAARNGGDHLTLELGVSLFACLSFLPIVRRDFTPRAVAMAALFASTAALCKQNGVLAFLPLIAFAIEERSKLTRRHVWAFVGAAAAPWIVILLWIRDVGALFDSVFAALSWYARQPAFSAPLTLRSEMIRSPESLLLLATGVVIAIMLLASGTRPLVVAAAAAAGVGELLPRFVRNYPHYDINVWPFLALIFVIAMASERHSTRVACRRLVVIVATVAALYVVIASRWHQPSALLSTFNPAAARIAAVTPPDGVVRQYGSEPILEFLAQRREEVVNKPYAAVFGAVWDGSRVYAAPPSPATTVVFVWTGQAWVAPLIRSVVAEGFVRVGVYGTIPRVAIFVHRSRLPAEGGAGRNQAPSD